MNLFPMYDLALLCPVSRKPRNRKQKELKNPARQLIILLILTAAFISAWSPPAKAQELPMEMMVTNRYANVRKGPGAGYDLVATLYRGDRILAERKFRNWLRVLIPDGSMGWVREDLVGPFDPDKRDFSNAEADSLKQLVDSRNTMIAGLEDSSRRAITAIQVQETERDSLMALLGLTEIPSMRETLAAAGADTLAMKRPRPVSPFEPQKSVLEARESFLGRATFSPRLGVLVSSGEATAAGAFSYEMNLTREFSYKLDLTTGSFGPQMPGTAEGLVTHTFATLGLVYNYEPGNLAVPFVEVGAGAARSSSGDSSATGLALVFGAGFRLYFTPDLALEAGYRGNAVMSGDNELLGLIYMGGGIHLPRHLPLAAPPWKGSIYISPFAGYQMFSPRFSFNGAGMVGVRGGYRLYEKVAAEVEAGWLPLRLNEGTVEKDLSAAQLAARALYYPWGTERGVFVQGGAGTLLLSGNGRPPSRATNYSFLSYGAGASLMLTADCALTGEASHLIFTSVARILPEFEVGSASAVRISAGMNLKF